MGIYFLRKAKLNFAADPSTGDLLGHSRKI